MIFVNGPKVRGAALSREKPYLQTMGRLSYTLIRDRVDVPIDFRTQIETILKDVGPEIVSISRDRTVERNGVMFQLRLSSPGIELHLGISSTHLRRTVVRLRPVIVDPAPTGIDFGGAYPLRDIVISVLASARRGDVEALCGLGHFMETHPGALGALLGRFTAEGLYRRAARRGSLYALALEAIRTNTISDAAIVRGLFTMCVVPPDGIRVFSDEDLASVERTAKSGGRCGHALLAWNELAKHDADLCKVERLLGMGRAIWAEFDIGEVVRVVLAEIRRGDLTPGPELRAVDAVVAYFEKHLPDVDARYALAVIASVRERPGAFEEMVVLADGGHARANWACAAMVSAGIRAGDARFAAWLAMAIRGGVHEACTLIAGFLPRMPRDEVAKFIPILEAARTSGIIRADAFLAEAYAFVGDVRKAFAFIKRSERFPHTTERMIALSRILTECGLSDDVLRQNFLTLRASVREERAQRTEGYSNIVTALLYGYGCRPNLEAAKALWLGFLAGHRVSSFADWERELGSRPVFRMGL
jgi:hypothetical protein